MGLTEIDLEKHSKNLSLTTSKIKDGAVTTSKINIDNNLNLNNFKIINVADPINDSDAANKRYVDSLINGLSWKNPVDNIISYDQLPNNLGPSDKGKRYLINSGTNINYIYEWDGNQWITFIPHDNWALFNKSDDNAYVYNPESFNDFKWVLFTSLGGAVIYNPGTGIDITNNTISAKLGAGITSLPNGYIGVDIEFNSGLTFDSDPSSNPDAKLKIDTTKVVTTYSSSVIQSDVTFDTDSILNVNGEFNFKSKTINDFVNLYSETFNISNPTNVITLTYTPLNSIDTQIFINGILQISGYNINSEDKTITFTDQIPSNSIVKVYYYTNDGSSANGMIIGYLSGGNGGSGDNLGNHIMTQDLNTNNNKIYNEYIGQNENQKSHINLQPDSIYLYSHFANENIYKSVEIGLVPYNNQFFVINNDSDIESMFQVSTTNFLYNIGDRTIFEVSSSELSYNPSNSNAIFVNSQKFETFSLDEVENYNYRIFIDSYNLEIQNKNLTIDSYNGGLYLFVNNDFVVNTPRSIFNSNVNVSNLEVYGTFKLADGNQGEGKVLVSDNQGIARWENINVSGDNLGNHTATENLNLNGFQIIEVSEIKFRSNTIRLYSGGNEYSNFMTLDSNAFNVSINSSDGNCGFYINKNNGYGNNFCLGSSNIEYEYTEAVTKKIIVVDISEDLNIPGRCDIIQATNNTGDTISAGTAVYIDHLNKEVLLADNNDINTIAQGIVIEDSEPGDFLRIAINGVIPNIGITSRFIYLGENGEIIENPPTGSNKVVQILGEVIGDYIIIKPQIVTIALT